MSIRGGLKTLDVDTPLVSFPVRPGVTTVRLDALRFSGTWRFSCPNPSTVIFDYLAAEPITVADGTTLARADTTSYVPVPRVRLTIDELTYEVVCSAAAVLERTYTDESHADAYTTNRWGTRYHEARLRQCRRLLLGVTGDVCDVGSGHSMVFHSGHWPDEHEWPFSVHACDVDPAVVDFLQAHGVDARLASADDPPFDAGQFDAVYAGEVIEHLVKPHQALRRWVQLLKPGGRLIVTTPNRRHLLTRIRGYEVVENPEHLFEWDLHQLRHALASAGANVRQVEGLVLQIPVYKPGSGWRDLGQALCYRFGGKLERISTLMIGAGRHVPTIAYDLAAVGFRED